MRSACRPLRLLPVLALLLGPSGCSDEGPLPERTVLDIRLEGEGPLAGALVEIEAPSIGPAQTPRGPAETWEEGGRTYVVVILPEPGLVEFSLRIEDGAPVPGVRPLEVIDGENAVLDETRFTAAVRVKP